MKRIICLLCVLLLLPRAGCRAEENPVTAAYPTHTVCGAPAPESQ